MKFRYVKLIELYLFLDRRFSILSLNIELDLETLFHISEVEFNLKI